MKNKTENTMDTKLTKENKINIMKAIKNIVKAERLKQRHVAEVLDIKQPRVSDLLALKHERFSLDILMQYLALFGCKISITFAENPRGKPINVKTVKCRKAFRTLAK